MAVDGDLGLEQLLACGDVYKRQLPYSKATPRIGWAFATSRDWVPSPWVFAGVSKATKFVRTA